MNQQQFVAKYLPYAQDTERRYGIPALWLLSIAANESGWGGSSLSSDYNNYSGIKWTGSGPYVEMKTQEEDANRNLYWTTAKFRTYETPQDGFDDIAQVITGNERYAPALKAKNATEFATSLQRAGYATDSTWGSKIGNIANSLGGGDNVVVPRYGPGETDAGIGGGGETTDAEQEQIEREAAAADASGIPTGPSSSGAPYGSAQYWSDYLAELDNERKSIQKEIAADPDRGYYNGLQTRLGQLQTAMNQAGTQYRQAAADERATSGDMTAYQQAQVSDAAAGRQTQMDIAKMSDQIRRGELQFQQAQNQFANNLANQKAAMEASKWAVPEGMQYFPQFGPGESMAVGSKILGAKFSPIDVQRMRYEPVQLPSPMDFGYGQQAGGSPGGGIPSPGGTYPDDDTTVAFQGREGAGPPPPSPYSGNEPWGSQAMYAPSPGPTPSPGPWPAYANSNPYAGPETGPWQAYGTAPAPAAQPAQPGRSGFESAWNTISQIPGYFGNALGAVGNATGLTTAYGPSTGYYDPYTRQWVPFDQRGM